MTQYTAAQINQTLDAMAASLKSMASDNLFIVGIERGGTPLAKALAELGVPSDTSCANFILVRFADQAEAEACDDYLKSQGLIVRRVAGYKLPNCLRITVGDEASCARVVEAVKEFKGRA